MPTDFTDPDRRAYDLSERVVVVVGGGQMPGPKLGNGRATALVAARHGARVAVVDIDVDSAARTVDMISAEGGHAAALRADVADDDDCARLFAEVLEQFGRIDGMVYSVAINPPFDRAANRMARADVHRGLDVNLLGALACNRLAGEAMLRNDGDTKGSIVNISSIASVTNRLGLNAGIMPYALGKAGLNFLTELTASQFAGTGVRANTLMLGPIDTSLGNHDAKVLFGFTDEQVEQAYAATVKLKMGRATAWETGYAVLYLLADESRFMTGQQIRLDGGAAL